MKTKQLLFAIAFTVLTSSWTKPVHAADFLFGYDVNYSVLASGITQVKQDVTLTNQTTQYYAQNYRITLKSERINNIHAFDQGGVITVQVSQNAGETVITLPFNEKAVGLGSQLTFSLTYDSRDIAVKKGAVWELIIPGLEDKNEIDSYTVHLKVPKSFGKAAYISPSPNSDGYWTQKDLDGRGITAAYGDVQNFSFRLHYFLENVSGKEEMQEIAFPPDTAFQKVILWKINEPPQNTYVDADGNWLAQYVLQKDENKQIIVEGNALIYHAPIPGSEVELTPDKIKTYTMTQPYWDQTDEITALANKLRTPRAIYDYVVNTLQYAYNRVQPGVQRLGAKAVLAQPQKAICMEFSDLFVALSRAAGIPAREIHGFAYTTNSRLQPLSLVSDVLHAWAQYYDIERKEWVSVDPTWGNTTLGVDYFNKLDFNHVAFAILGVNSDYPYPAGSYRTQTGDKNVFIDISDTKPEIPGPQIELQFELPDRVFVGVKTEGKIKIINRGNVLYVPAGGNLVSSLNHEAELQALPAIPPYGFIEVPISLVGNWSWIPRSYPLQFDLGNTSTTKNIIVVPFYLSPAALVLVGCISLMALGIFLFFHARRKTQIKS